MNGSGAQDSLPSGEVTLFFSDIEGSTELLQRMGDAYLDVFVRHADLMRSSFRAHGGYEVDAAGDGFFAAFPAASSALSAAVETQRALHSARWAGDGGVRVRMGMHTGRPKLVAGAYVGLDVHRAARICAAGNGGQILLSGATCSRLSDENADTVSLVDRGAHRLNGLHFPERVFEAIVAGLPACSVPIRSLSNRPNNLPPSVNPFVGREAERRALDALLRSPTVRLVTLTGVGGVGKTRLGLEAARGVQDLFPSGVFLVPLAPVSDAALVAATIASAIGVPELPGHPVTETLKASLADRQMLLGLDNFEQVIEAAAVGAELLVACPKLRVLVTSRQPLRLQEERLFGVSPMALTTQQPVQLSAPESEAAELFEARMREHQPNFRTYPDNSQLVTAICQELDGLPLAIELAASRARLMPLPLLKDRLGDRLALLKGGNRDATGRHETLRAAIDWSYDLLDEADKVVFRRASVFAGGLPLAAAEHVCSDASVPKADVVDRLMDLSEQNLLVSAGTHGEPRLDMLETIRAYARERLVDSAEQATVRDRHARYYVTFAEQRASALLGGGFRDAAAELIIEEDNIRAALTRALELPTPQWAAPLLSSLLWHWIPRGQLAEGRSWADRAVARWPEPSLERARVLEVAGWLHLLSGDYPTASPLCEEGVAMLKELGEAGRSGRLLTALGATSAGLGKIPEGPEMVGQALSLCRAAGDDYGAAVALIAIGEVARAMEDHPAAVASYAEAMDLLQPVGNTYWPALVQQNLAHFALHEGDWVRAASLLQETLQLGQQYNYPMAVNLYLAAMGGVAAVRGQAVRAVEIFGAVTAQLAALGASFEPTDQAEMDRYVQQLKEVLTEGAFQDVFTRGLSWDLEQALAAAATLGS